MKKNLLFILIDCLRANACFETERKIKTPTIDILSKSGVSFTKAVSATSTTSPSVASIMTGLYPFSHGIEGLIGHKLKPDCMTIAEVFKRNGYKTCAMVTGPLMNELGLDRGFDEYLFRNSHVTLYTGFEKELLLKIGELSQGPAPWFLFVHLFELHLPRKLLPEFDSNKFGNNSYERALSSLDSQLDIILRELNLDNTIIVITGDHGENVTNALLESFFWKYKRRLIPLRRSLLSTKRRNRHVWMGHGCHVYDPLIRVPLIFVGHDIFPPGRVIDNLVSHVDIYPTIVNALGRSVLPEAVMTGMDGRSLMPLLKGEKMPERPVYVSACGREIREEDRLEGLRTSDWKFIFAPHNPKIRQELYNIKDDPDESRNLASTMPDMVKKFKEELAVLKSIGEARLRTPETKMVDEEIEKVQGKLRELGYL